jgi:hypothetical protein
MRFTIRDLLWLTGVVGICGAWWADHREARAVIRVQSKSLSGYSDYVRAQSDEERAEIMKKMADIQPPRNYLRWIDR